MTASPCMSLAEIRVMPEKPSSAALWVPGDVVGFPIALVRLVAFAGDALIGGQFDAVGHPDRKKSATERHRMPPEYPTRRPLSTSPHPLILVVTFYVRSG